MDPRLVPPAPAGSPWAGWALPDIKHCEANGAGWIAAPVNAWTNLPYVGLGLWIMRRSPDADWLSAGGLGPVSILVGVTSFVFHASYTFAGQAADYAGMFALTGWAIGRACWRAGWLTRPQAKAFWAGLFAASMAALFAFRAAGLAIQWVMIVQAVAIAALELRLLPKNRPYFWTMQALLAAAYACWHLDHADAFCRPDGLLQWHAVWHVLTAGAFYAAWRFHRAVDGAIIGA